MSVLTLLMHWIQDRKHVPPPLIFIIQKRTFEKKKLQACSLASSNFIFLISISQNTLNPMKQTSVMGINDTTSKVLELNALENYEMHNMRRIHSSDDYIASVEVRN